MRLLAIFLAALIGTQAFAADIKGDDPVLKVNGVPITFGQVEEALRLAVANGLPNNDETQQKVLNDLVIEETLLMQAKVLKIDQKPEITHAMNDAVRQVLLRAVLSDYLAQHPVSDADVKAQYDLLVKEYQNAKQYHVKHILFEDEAAAKRLIDQLRSRRTTFTKAAKSSLDTARRDNGGSFGWHELSEYPVEFQDSLIHAKKGQLILKPIKTKVGYHVIQVEDLRDVTIPKFEAMESEIRDALIQAKLTEYIRQLRRV